LISLRCGEIIAVVVDFAGFGNALSFSFVGKEGSCVKDDVQHVHHR